VRACTHGLTVEDWADLLAWLLPGEYAEPPPPAPSAVQTRLGRTALYATRAAVDPRTHRLTARTTALFGGLVDQEQVDDLGRQAVRCRNGAVNPREALRPSEAPGPDADARGEGGRLNDGWRGLAALRERNRAAWAGRERRQRGILSTEHSLHR
jgi:hypothetical protein